MFCDKCGAKLDDNTKICDKCGAPVEQMNVLNVSADGTASEGTPRGFSNKRKVLLISLAAAVLIERTAFYNCKNLTSVTIPDSVSRIGSNAFKGCESITITAGGKTYRYSDLESLYEAYK